MNKFPFFVGNLAACVVPGTERRRHTRAYVNMFFFYGTISRFIRHTFGQRVKSIKFIRQFTLGRVVFLVNEKYYVKIFRDVSNARLRDHAFLMDWVVRNISVKTCGRPIAIPRIHVARRAPMYACPRVAGRHLDTFTKAEILQNKEKIEKQVANIINALQSIDVGKIPNNSRFMNSMQSRTPERPAPPRPVLAHFDLNINNFLFDDDLNICAVIDWDTLSIAQNPETDMTIFNKYWSRFMMGLSLK